MILSQINVSENKLEIDFNRHEYSWEYYLGQYISAFACILDIARAKRYKINKMSMPFLFLMRHSVELLLKYLIVSNNKKVPNTHKITALAEGLGAGCKEFVAKLDVLYCDTAGDCFRYPDVIGEFKNKSTKLQSVDVCNCFIEFYNANRPQTFKSIEPLCESKKMNNELFFKPSENRTLGQFSTSYDFAIFELLNLIQNDSISIQDIYLPLLFFYRHTLELKLKDEIKTIKPDCKLLCKEHSVCKLKNVFENIVKDAIERIDDPKFKELSKDYMCKTLRFEEVIHNLDKNSLYFRYPFDENGEEQLISSIKKTTIYTIYTYYKVTDSFLSFAVYHLSELGYLDINERNEN